MTAIHQPPAGARDWLPLEVAQKLWIGDRLQETFRRWGYQRIITSTLERLETLQAGGAIRADTVIQVPDPEGTLGLRPEMTASVARTCAARLADKLPPQRLYYTSNVFRNSSHHGRQVEFYQLGVELLGAGSELADAEVLLLLADCLQSLSLTGWTLVLGEAGLTRALLQPFPEPARSQVRRCLAHLDRVGLEQLDLGGLQERALLLFDLRGTPETVVQTLSGLDLDAGARAAVDRLKSLLTLLECARGEPLPIALDLSLVQTIDYYTGITFEVAVQPPAEARGLGWGGRYDRLLELYDPQRPQPGVGFALSLEDLHACLLAAGQLPEAAPTSEWLVVPLVPEAAAAALDRAQTMREQTPGLSVEVELTGRRGEDARDRARECRIRQIAWVGPDGATETETLD